MALPPMPVLQGGLPEFLPGLLGLAGTLVLLLVLAAVAGIVYRVATGGIEWPDEGTEDDDTVDRGEADDEWDYY